MDGGNGSIENTPLKGNAEDDNQSSLKGENAKNEDGSQGEKASNKSFYDDAEADGKAVPHLPPGQPKDKLHDSGSEDSDRVESVSSDGEETVVKEIGSQSDIAKKDNKSEPVDGGSPRDGDSGNRASGANDPRAPRGVDTDTRASGVNDPQGHASRNTVTIAVLRGEFVQVREEVSGFGRRLDDLEGQLNQRFNGVEQKIGEQYTGLLGQIQNMFTTMMQQATPAGQRATGDIAGGTAGPSSQLQWDGDDDRRSDTRSQESGSGSEQNWNRRREDEPSSSGQRASRNFVRETAVPRRSGQLQSDSGVDHRDSREDERGQNTYSHPTMEKEPGSAGENK